MTVVLEAARLRPAIPQTDDQADVADALEEVIAAHRTALRELAPHQAWRSVREETAWHITELGLLLRVRGVVHAGSAQQKAAPGMMPNQERPDESAGTDRLTH